MRRCLVLFGATCVIAQVLMLRELSVAFEGNELIYGAALATWLALFAAGSGVLGRCLPSGGCSLAAMAWTLALSGAMVPAALILSRCLRWVLAGKSGIAPGLGTVLFLTVMSLLPLCPTLGAFYAAACRMAARRPDATGRDAARVYVFDAIGAFLGGTAFTFLLVHVCRTLTLALCVTAADGLAAFMLWRNGPRPRGRWGWPLPLFALLPVAAILTPASDVIGFATRSLRYPNRTLVASTDTPYGRVDVARSPGQTEFYHTGAPAGVTETEQSAEETALPAILAHPLPRRMLIIGGSVAGVPRKALLAHWLQIDLVELDGALVRAAREHAPEEDRRALASPRLRVFSGVDGRLFLKRARGRYDVILCAVPNPSSGLINRFYTVECFREARRALAPKGVLALNLHGAPDYMSAPHRAVAAEIWRTLRRVFPSVAALPTDHEILFFASPDRRMDKAELDMWPVRLQTWQLTPRWLSPAKAREMTRPDRAERLAAVLAAEPARGANSDLQPVAYFHALRLWAEAFRAPGRRLIAAARKLDLWIVAGAIATFTGIMALIVTFARRPAAVGVPVVSACAGAAAITMQMVLVFAFQSIYGYVYGYVGLLFGAFMIGGAVGAWGAGRLSVRGAELLVLMMVQTAGALGAAAAAPALATIMGGGPLAARVGAFGFIPAAALFFGAVAGALYPLAAAAFAGGREETPGRAAATIYAFDLCGACAGAALGGTILAPILGLARSSIAVSLLSLASLPLLLLAGRKS